MQCCKRVITIFSLVLSAVLGFSSCERELENPGDGVRVPQGVRTCSIYFGIDTGSAAQTRADGDLVDTPSSWEYAIGGSGNFAILFKEQAGNFVFDGIYGMAFASDEFDHGHKVDAVYKTTYSLEEGESIPTFECLVVLNAPWLMEKLSAEVTQGQWASRNKDDVRALVWEALEEDPSNIGFFYESGKRYLTMSSSAYMDGNDKKDFVEISSSNIIFGNESEKELMEKIVYVHVERMVSKYTFGLENYKDDYIFTPKETSKVEQNHQVVLCTGWTNKYLEDGATVPMETDDWEPVLELRNWQAKFLGWGMNALETQSHVFKNIRNGNYFDNWNDANNYRSYWSEDPHYQGDYPWQNRRAVNNNLNWYGNQSPTWTNLLRNYAWNDPHFACGPQFDTVYTPENTYDAEFLRSQLDGRMELLAGTHLIVRTELQVQDAVDSENFETFPYLYRDRAGVCYKTAQDCLWGLVRAFNYALSSQTVMKYNYYDWDPNRSVNVLDQQLLAVPTVTYDNSATLDKGLFKLYYKGKELTYEYIMYDLKEDDCKELLKAAQIKNGDGQRLLDTSDFTVRKIDPNNNSFTELPIYSRYDIGVDPDTHQEYNNSKYRLNRSNVEKKNDMQSLFLEWAGPVDLYLGGRMYYAYPAYIKKDEIYGAVRNAWYQFTVTGINNIGIPVHDENLEIVPNWDNPFNQINVKVNILGWHDFTYVIEKDLF